MTDSTSKAPVERAGPCSDPRATQFDFWLGAWEAAWGDDGYGTNVITKALGGCVILENFTDLDPGPDALVGMSVSTFVAKEDCWKQTWVDNQGGYLDFKGGMDNGRMVLSRTTEHEGKTIHQRMVWYDIEADTFEWNWDRSDDGGETWMTLWHIHYRRKLE